MANIEKYSEKAIELVMIHGPKLLLALVTLVVGWRLVALFVRFLDQAMDRQQVDLTLQRFILNLARILLRIILLVSVASMVGVATTSLVAMLGAAGLAIGLALQGSLANFAGGMLILFFKPFKVEDIIEAQGYVGQVHEIQIFNTIIKTLDNKRVIIPNSLLSNGCLTNVFAEPTRRVDLTYGISYQDDIGKAKEILWGLVKADSRILETPEAEVYVAAHADSAVNLLVRVWVNSGDYWKVHFAMQEQVKLAFDRENITIPFPQRDVHLFTEVPAG